MTYYTYPYKSDGTCCPVCPETPGCDCDENICWYTWTIEWDCNGPAWFPEPTISNADVVCYTADSDPPTPVDTWTPLEGDPCVLQYTSTGVLSGDNPACTIVLDCPTPEFAPTVPADPSNCGCYCTCVFISYWDCDGGGTPGWSAPEYYASYLGTVDESHDWVYQPGIDSCAAIYTGSYEITDGVYYCDEEWCMTEHLPPEPTLAEPDDCCEDCTDEQPPIQFVGACADYGAGACNTQSIPFTSVTWDGVNLYYFLWGGFSGAYVSLVYDASSGVIYSDAGGNTIGSCTNIGANFIPYCEEFSDPGNCEGLLINLYCVGGVITGTMSMGVYATDCYNGGTFASMTLG